MMPLSLVLPWMSSLALDAIRQHHPLLQVRVVVPLHEHMAFKRTSSNALMLTSSPTLHAALWLHPVLQEMLQQVRVVLPLQEHHPVLSEMLQQVRVVVPLQEHMASMMPLPLVLPLMSCLVLDAALQLHPLQQARVVVPLLHTSRLQSGPALVSFPRHVVVRVSPGATLRTMTGVLCLLTSRPVARFWKHRTWAAWKDF